MELRPVKSRSVRKAMMLVEAAMVLPLILAITLFLLQYAWLFLKVEQITNAARHGARRAIVANVTEAEVKAGVSNLLAASGIVDHNTVVSNLGVAKGEIVTVTITVPVSPQLDFVKFNDAFGFGPAILPTSLHSSVSMAKERS